ncbi:MAG: response regulator [Thermodesulfovibrionales bacterium]|nr:response regulator [Thermodesulfovibrionales bacterium]
MIKVLVVDFNDSYREQIRKALETKNCYVLEAKNGLVALQIAELHKPDIIVSGGLMPEIDGIVFLRKIKTLKTLEKIPFLFNSNFFKGEKEKKLVLSLGANAFFDKKIKAETLWDEITKVLNSSTEEKSVAISEEEFLKLYNEILFEKLIDSQLKIKFEQEQCLYLYNSIRDAILVSDTDRYIIKANQPATKEIFGYENEELLGKNARILFADEEGYNYTGKEVYNFKHYVPGKILQVNYKRKNGEIFPAEVYALKLLNEHGNPIGNIGIIRDISQRIQTEQKLKHTNRQFTELLNALPDRITLISSEWKILWANDFSLNYLGQQIEEVIGKLCYELWHHRSDVCDVCAVRETFKTGKPSMINVTTPDKKIWEVRTFPIKNEKDEILSVLSISRDITENKRLEEQLRQAQKMEAIGQLAGGIAHDFNNILTAIVGYATLLQLKVENSEPVKHYTNLILSLTEKAATLTKGLLAFSRKQIFNIKPENINEIIKNLEKILLRILREDIELKLYLFKQDLISIVDASQIEHVLMNLVTNACDAMPNGGILTISTDLVEIDEEYVKTHGYGKAGKYILISVEDTGIGMEQSIKERIFEPFFTTKEAGKGTGLGLSIAYGTIKQHNGYINVYSELEKGTTFKIYLPAFELKPMNYIRKPANNDIYLTGTETILLAEDDKAVRSGITEILRNYGYNIIESVDGEDAIVKFREHKDIIDLLIIDVIMPKKNGREAYQEMLLERPELKALFMSGYTSNIIHKKGILEENINFIAKPVSPIELLRKIRNILKGE